MEQFSLETYNKDPNRRIVTRDGRSVRIICTDRRADNHRPIVSLVDDYDSEVLVLSYEDGTHSDANDDLDLFFATEKHEGWINLAIDSSGEIFVATNYPHTDEKTAKLAVSDKSNVVATCKITWEE